jgi:hypothetical protein
LSGEVVSLGLDYYFFLNNLSKNPSKVKPFRKFLEKNHQKTAIFDKNKKN